MSDPKGIPGAKRVDGAGPAPRLLPAVNSAANPNASQGYLIDSEPAPGNVWVLVRKYLPSSAALLLLGALAGFATVIFEAPVFKARVMLEVNAINENYVKTSLDPLSGSFDPNAINVQTQIKLLQVGPVTREVYEEMLQEPAPKTRPAGAFADLRTRLRGAAAARAASQPVAVKMAMGTFDARPITGTRLIELSCESTQPELAAEFLNKVAERFIGETDKTRSESTERTAVWLAKQLEETDAKLKAAEEELQRFVEAGGTDFAAPGNMLGDAELKQLQGDLVVAQADRIAKQARLEAYTRTDVNSVPEVADDPDLRDIRKRLADIRDQRQTLGAVLTPKHYKMQRLDDAEKELLAAAKLRTDTIVNRLRTEYQGALRKQQLLTEAYQEKGGSVIAETRKVAVYNALKRDVDGLKANHEVLAQRIIQSGGSSSLPVGLMRMVDRSEPPPLAFKPNPSTQIGLGAFGGLIASLLFAAVREKMDKSIRSPGVIRTMLPVPELGVIPSAARVRARAKKLGAPVFKLELPGGVGEPERESQQGLSGRAAGSSGKAEELWGEGLGVMAESFRTTLASLIRAASGGALNVIMVTSPEPGDGKTTVASNLAIALAESGKSVVILDADFRKPKLRDAFGLSGIVDVTEVLDSDLVIEDCPLALLAASTGIPRLFASPSSRRERHVSDLIYSPRIGALIQRLRREFDFVLVDVPPILELADARVIGRHVDGAALVIKAGQTDRRLAVTACQCLFDDGIPVFGTILNQWDPTGTRNNSYYYHYHQTS